ncbi:MAG: aminodeoxychorismate synthase component I [Gammaproteobacteria bacterium]
MTTKLSELPYRRDSSEVFAAIADEPWSIFLDSCYPYTDAGRYDILASRPYITFETFGRETHVKSNGETTTTTDDPFALVKACMQKPEANLTGLPFCGGALGYFAYDLGRRIELLPEYAEQDIAIPEMAVGLYDWAVIVDHHKRRAWLTGYGNDERTVADWPHLQKIFSVSALHRSNGFTVNSEVQSNMSREKYAQAFARIQQYIHEGDCYQVNLAQRFSVEVSGNPWSAYLQLRKLNPAPYASFFNLPDATILSSSPERFLSVTNGLVETKPIKGTRPRSIYAYEDKALAAALLESEKDRAENLMIVDLLRNDIGKTCEPGSVSVPKLFALESFASVHHLVSTVTGRLAPEYHALDLLRGCFPGGSITGAPKLRSMEIIEELEPHRRSVYCGSIGYIGFDGNMDSNIAIRTMVHNQDRIFCWAGGGIVADSRMEAEYRECFDKVRTMLKLFETGIALNVGS